MSSSRLRERASGFLARHHPTGWSLRTRLLVELVGLVALVCVVLAGATEVALGSFLTAEFDSQLVAAGKRSAAAFDHPPPTNGTHPDGPAPGFLLAPGQATGTLGALVAGGHVNRAAVLTVSGNASPVPDAQLSALTALPADGKPYTRSLGTLGDYRLVAARAPSGVVLVTGLPMRPLYDTLIRLALIMCGVAAAAVLLTAVVGAVIVRITLRPLQRVARTAAGVAELPLDRGEVALPVRVPDEDTNPGTEVGQVGAALNRMLEHVAAALAARQASEVRVRRFVADASHELRTPLAAIRGYAELSRRSRAAVPPDIAFAMQRVESESARMTTLVEELLLLARLDSERQHVREPVDMSRLVADGVADAHVAGPRHHWRLELPEDPVAVTGDATQLQQVVSNLLANARTHTPAGTTVTTRLSVAAGAVVLQVVDDGPGIPEDLLPEVFERFARGDTSRSRAAGSSGLGLAIVRAVASAHDGRVEVSSRPGRTAFTVTLPLHAD